jgi:hypothetical protein
MTSTPESGATFLERLETFLDQGPPGTESGLKTYLEEFSSYRNAPDQTTLEKAFELFGTAVGKQSKL